MCCELSPEFTIIPYLNGVKLSNTPKNTIFQNALSVKDVLQFPCSVYFLDDCSKILSINELSAISCGYPSAQKAIDTTVFDVLIKDNAKKITELDKNVVQSESAIIEDDVMERHDGLIVNCLTVKVPMYLDDSACVFGIFGLSVVLQQQPLAQSLQLISASGLLKALSQSPNAHNKQKETYPINSIGLSDRQSQVVYYLVRGYSAKKIGIKLGISQRTVEYYIENIKNKYKVSTKIELIEQLMERFK